MKSPAENSVAVEEVSTMATVNAKTLSPLLKEIQGSFEIEGIHIPDERLMEYATEFEELKRNGDARARILEVLARRPFRQA